MSLTLELIAIGNSDTKYLLWGAKITPILKIMKYIHGNIMPHRFTTLKILTAWSTSGARGSPSRLDSLLERRTDRASMLVSKHAVTCVTSSSGKLALFHLAMFLRTSSAFCGWLAVKSHRGDSGIKLKYRTIEVTKHASAATWNKAYYELYEVYCLRVRLIQSKFTTRDLMQIEGKAHCWAATLFNNPAINWYYARVQETIPKSR